MTHKTSLSENLLIKLFTKYFKTIVFIVLCMLSFYSNAQCTSNATSTADEDILNVTFGTLNNTSSCASTGGAGSILNEYSNFAFAGFAGGVPNVDRGCVIPFSVQIGTCGGNYGNSVAIYIDWNNDLDFIDAGENVYLSAASTTGPHTETGNITIPLTATLGNCHMRIVNVETTPAFITPCGTYSWGETEDYFVNVTNGGGVAPYVSSNVNQILSGAVSQCANFQQIISIPVVMGAGCTAGSITQFVLGAGASTNLLGDVSKIHIYYTGTTNSFLAINEFVVGGTVPTGATNTINGSQSLIANATNYFWVAYDMNPLSTIGNLIDGSCSQITVSGINRTPTTTNPAGNGVIAICPCTFSLGADVALCAPISYTINGPAGYDSYVWSPGGAVTQNLGVTATGNYTCTATIINGGLVVNGDFSSGNTGFTSNYVLGGGGTWGPLSNPGTYSVTTNPNLAHSNFYSFGDHTTGTGNMMVCNGSSVANDVAWSQTITVTANTNYNFSAWMASTENTSAGSEAQLQFSINGVLIGSVTSAPLTGGTWANFFVNWNSGTNTSAVIKIVDQNISGGANDFVLDDITFERICVYSDVIAITANSSPTVTVPANSVVCNSTSIAAMSFTSSPAGATFTWTNSNPSIGLAASGTSNTPTFVGTNSGTTAITAIITVTPSFGSCIGTPKTFTITINPNPIITTSTTNSVICLGNTTSVNGIGASTYTWSGGITNGTTFSPTVTTTYTVTGTSVAGCTNTAVQTITVSTNPILTASASNSVICIGNSTTLNGGGASTYTWTNGVIDGTAFSPTVTTSYTVTGTSVAGCTNTAVQTITVNATPTITVNSATICSGSTAALTANGATTYTWSTVATTSSISVNPTVNTIYTVTGTDNGCTSSNTSTVSISSTALIAVNNPTICDGQSATLTANGVTNYTWSPAATLSSSTGSLVTANPTITTVYSIMGSAGTCTASGTSTVTVNSNPTVAASASNSVICIGSSITLNGGGASTYTWTNGVIDGVIFSPTTTSTYTVIGTSVAGCTNTAVQTITVNSTPTITVNSATICSGSTATLTASGATTYTWSTAATTSSISVNPTINTIYTVTGTNNGCTNSSSTSVIVNSIPVLTVNNPTLCSGENGTLTANPSPAGGTFIWLPSNQVSQSINVNTLSSSTYSVLYAVNGCSVSATSNVIVSSNPSISVSSSTICNGQSASLNASPSIIGGNFTWTLGGQNTSSITDSPSNTTTYGVLYSINGCSATSTGTIVVNQNPTIVISSSPLSTISSLETVSINASGGALYSWNTGETTSTIAVNPQTTTNYCVNVTSSAGCTNTDCITITVIDESSLFVPNSFTPNGDGVNDFFITPNHNISNYNIAIFNRWGQQLFNSQDPQVGWDGKFSGQLVPYGVYVYILKAKGNDNVDYKFTGHITVFK